MLKAFSKRDKEQACKHGEGFFVYRVEQLGIPSKQGFDCLSIIEVVVRNEHKVFQQFYDEHKDENEPNDEDEHEDESNDEDEHENQLNGDDFLF